MTSPLLTLRDASCHERRVRLRLPFRFGNALVEELPVLYLRTVFETPESRRLEGFAAAVVSGAWFDKRDGRSLAQRERALYAALGAALALHAELEPATAWRRHERASAVLLDRGRRRGLPDLVTSFGIALLDAAAVDAVCRNVEAPLHAALREGLLGMEPAFAATLPPHPVASLLLRHTVGLADPLCTRDLADDVPDDGLPRSLDEIIERTGVRAFKVKVGGDLEATRERLRAIEKVLAERSPEAFVTLDANEQIADPDALVRFVEGLERDLSLDRFRARIRWLEQPLPRDVALQPEARPAVARTGRVMPVVLDESDGCDDVAALALERGYHGVSAKNGKGVFRTLHSHAVLQEEARTRGTATVLAGEDLTLPAVVAWHQDTAVASALGLEHVERNAQHFLRGLDHLTHGERERALATYPALYERRADDLVALRVRDGRLDLSDLLEHPFGVAHPPDWEALAPIDPSARGGDP